MTADRQRMHSLAYTVDTDPLKLNLNRNSGKIEYPLHFSISMFILLLSSNESHLQIHEEQSMQQNCKSNICTCPRATMDACWRKIEAEEHLGSKAAENNAKHS